MGLVAALLTTADASATHGRASGRRADSSVAVATVERLPVGHGVSPGFLGLSMEYSTVPLYTGADPGAEDPVLMRLIQNLAPRQQPVLRIGGTTTDWAWRPVAGVSRPPWVRFVMTDRWVEVTRALAERVRAHLILSINLEANSPGVAGDEARSLLAGIGRSRIEAFELGNEPELYGRIAWYRTPGGRAVLSRSRHYDFADYMSDYSRVARSLPLVPLAGPSTGGASAWTRPLGRFLVAEPRVGLVTMHRYGLDRCDMPPPVLTAGELLTQHAQERVASSVAQSVRTAHAHGVALRIEELNAVACGGQDGVSNAFASALWALDTMFEALRVGVDGVNIHTRASGLNSLFTVEEVNGVWRAVVRPEYYGLMMFVDAAPVGSRLLRVAEASGGPVRIWATMAPDGHVRVVLINEDPNHQRKVELRVPSAKTPGALERLEAPNLRAMSDVTLGGRSFGAETKTGLLAGRYVATLVKPVGGQYIIQLPAASAATLKF
jgi:hypothetical protein